MNSLYVIVGALAAVALIGSIGANLQQQATAEHPVGGAKNFKDLTNEYEKAVLDAVGNADEIQRLVDQYHDDIMALLDVNPSLSR